ncbi:UNVERIFIED_CONTAM: hypothetical protein K2H54_056624 [Gekko kuhli]
MPVAYIIMSDDRGVPRCEQQKEEESPAQAPHGAFCLSRGCVRPQLSVPEDSVRGFPPGSSNCEEKRSWRSGRSSRYKARGCHSKER